MANIRAIHSLGNAIVGYLQLSYPAQLQAEHPCTFELLSSNDMDKKQADNSGTSVGLYLYGVTVNEHLRNNVLVHRPFDSLPPLSLDLHYLATIWAESAPAEHVVAAWLAHEFYRHPVMDMSVLAGDADDAGWRADTVIQIVPQELATEDMMRIWDTLAPNYRLSLSYVARAVRIDVEDTEDQKPVVATSYRYGGLTEDE